MTVWREVRGPALLAYALGAVAGWAVSGRYDVLRGAVVLAAVLGSVVVLGRTRGVVWAWRVVPLLVPAGWLGGVLMWHWALVMTTLLSVLPIWGAMIAARREGALAVAGAYAVLVGAILLDAVPPWSALGVLTVPFGLRAGRTPPEPGAPAWRDWLIALNAQVLLGFLIKGMVR